MTLDPFAMIADVVNARQEPWRQHAACRGLPPAWFFGESSTDVALARAVCADCPVRQQCLDAACDNHEQFGVFGGLTVKERRRVSKGLPAHMRRQPIKHGTHGGYSSHLRRREVACEACRAAHAAYRHERRHGTEDVA